MATRAKFKVTEKTEAFNQGFKVKLVPVTDGSPEDKEFFKWTPAGEITLVTITDSTALGFKVGSSYYVDFTEVPEAQ